MTENNILGPRNYLYETAEYSPAEMETMYDRWVTYDEETEEKLFNGFNLTGQYFTEYAEKLGMDKSIKILDVGAGTGNIGRVLAGLGYTNIDGVDGSTNMLEKAEKLGVYNKCVHAWIDGVTKMPFTDNNYDAAAGSGMICPSHVPLQAFYDIARVVKLGGFIINTMRNEWTKPGEFCENFHEFTSRLEKEQVWEKVFDVVIEDGYCKTAGIDALVSIFRVK